MDRREQKSFCVITAAEPGQDTVPPSEYLKIKRYINNIVFQEAKDQSHHTPDLLLKNVCFEVFTPVAVKQNNENVLTGHSRDGLIILQ